MPTPRKEQVSKNTDGYYHCVSRTVRRAYLCGIDLQQDCKKHLYLARRVYKRSAIHQK